MRHLERKGNSFTVTQVERNSWDLNTNRAAHGSYPVSTAPILNTSQVCSLRFLDSKENYEQSLRKEKKHKLKSNI